MKVVISTLKLSELISILKEELASKVLIFDYNRAEVTTVFLHMDFINLLLNHRDISGGTDQALLTRHIRWTRSG